MAFVFDCSVNTEYVLCQWHLKSSMFWDKYVVLVSAFHFPIIEKTRHTKLGEQVTYRQAISAAQLAAKLRLVTLRIRK